MIRTKPLPWIGECYADEARPYSQQDICNWIPSQAEVQGTLTPMMAKTPPGLFPYLEIPGTVVPPEGEAPGYTIPSKPVRGTYNCENKLFAVIGNTQYQISNSGVAIPIGTIPGVTRTQSTHNQITLGNQMVTVNGSAGYCYNTATQVFERITDPGFAGGITAKFIDGYILCIEPGRRFVGHSDLANALEWNTLDRFTSEYKPDLLVTDAVTNNEYLLFSEQSAEFFVNTGASQQPFRTKRVYMDVGCSGRYNAASIDNSVLWHGSDGKFYELEGYGPRRISTRPIEQAVRGLNWSQAFAEVWDDAGHSVVYWTFPGGHTWGFDRATRKWHRRESLGMDRWRVNTLTKWRQDWYAGDFQTGRIWRLDWDYVLEGDDEFISECTGPVIHDSQNPITMVRCEPLLDVGHQLTVPAEFPEQPEGPTIIAPPLPDGVVGSSWAGGTYSAVGGTPPYVFTSRPGTTWPGDLGPMSAAGVVSAETPTSAGSGENIARVTDANGLFDELTDVFEITIAPGVMMAQPVASDVIYSLDGGLNWIVAANDTSPGSVDLKAIAGGRFITLDLYTDDLGGTAWLAATSEGNKNYELSYRGSNVVWGANGPFELPQISADGGVTAVNGGDAAVNGLYSPVYSGATGPLIGTGKPDNFMVSTDHGVTWSSTGVAHGLNDNNTSHASCKYSGGAVFAGSNIGISAIRVVFTEDGTSLVGGDISGLGTSTGVGKRPSSICAGYVDGVETVVVLGTDAGELFWTQDEGATWHLITYPLGPGVLLNAIAWNGVRFVLGGALASVGYLKYSAELVTWADCTFPVGPQGFHAIASQEAP